MKWRYKTTLAPEATKQEIWILEDGGREREYPVEVRFGKPIDILSLKAQAEEDLKKKVEQVSSSRRQVYGNPENLEEVKSCPICSAPSSGAREVLKVYKAVYHQCPECFHYYLLAKPTDSFLDNFYKESTEYQSTYADKETQASRLEWISKPKAEYVLDQYKKQYGRLPKKVLDIGAGSGHFVYTMRQMGIDCDGVEISRPGIKFAKEVFDVELLDENFFETADKYEADMVTFWGLIEHVSRPVEMLRAADRALSREGMVVAEVPRWNCFGEAVHKASPDSIVRHVDPMDHIQLFSDSSMATAFVLSGLDLTSVWYFGMDAYEFLSQLVYTTGDDKIMQKWGEKIPILQQPLDQGRLSDFGLYIGVPNKIGKKNE